MFKNFHNGTNIIAKHYTIFLGEEILEFFMAPTVKTHLSVLAQKIPALQPGAKGVGAREILETCSNSASKNTSETDIFPHGPKSLLTSVIWRTLKPICWRKFLSGHTQIADNFRRNFFARGNLSFLAEYFRLFQ
jgi:hypothetical protein